MTFDIAVIGAGVSGIAASLLLANTGRRVALIEKCGRTAPVVRGFPRQGLQFDTGFHYGGGLGEGEILHTLLRHLGVADRLERVPLDPEGFDTVRCLEPEFTFRFPSGIERLRERLHAAFPGERTGIDAYLEDVENACAAFPYMNLEGNLPGNGFPDGSSLQDVLDRHLSDPLLKGVLSVHTLLYGVPPSEAPFVLHALVAGPYYRGAHGIRGGGKSLSDAFDAELARRGVEVFCGEGARSLLFADDGRVNGVLLESGSTLSCQGCVATVHPRHLLELVPEGVFRPAYRKRLQGLEESASAFLLFGEADHSAVRDLPRGNLFLLGGPEDAGRTGAEDPATGPVYLTSAHPLRNGAGGGFLAIVPCAAPPLSPWAESRRGSRPPEYRAFKESMVRIVQNRLESFFPGFGGTIRWAEGATPLTLRDYGGSPDGGLYGINHRVGQFNPQPQTRVSNLWLAGQGVAAPGVLGAIVSAYLACGEILGHEPLRRELRHIR